MTTLFTCKYMQASIYKINKTVRDNDEKFRLFIETFHEQCPNLEKKKFIKDLKRFIEIVNRKKIDKDEVINEYGAEKWNKLSAQETGKHSYKQCKECLILEPTEFVVKFRSPAAENPAEAEPLNNPSTPVTPVTPLQSLSLNTSTGMKMKDKVKAAQSLLEQADKQFQQELGTPFSHLLTKIPGSQYQLKENSYDKKKKIRQMSRNMKKKFENHAAEVDALTFYGTRQTKSNYEKQRMAIYFESREDARKRTEKSKLLHLFFYFPFI